MKGLPEYFIQKEATWYADEEKLSSLWLRFSLLFDVAEKTPEKVHVLQQELKVLDVVERAIVWQQTNDIKNKVKAFDAVFDAREKVQDLKLKEMRRITSYMMQKRMRNGWSYERD